MRARTCGFLAGGNDRWAATLFCALGSVASHAQTSDEDAASVSPLEEITVTATRREMALQDAPAAITALSAEALRASDIADLRGLSAQVPGLVVGGPAQLGTNPISIRGIGQNPQGVGSDDSVAVYQDGVYLGRAYGSVFDFVDVARVEVLRGPQGTLYGRNATGGALSIVTREPGSEPSAYFDVRYTDLQEYRVRALVSGPLAAGRLLGQLAGSIGEKDGYVTNRVTGGKLLGEEQYAVRGKLKFQASNGATVVLTADASELEVDAQSKLLSDPVSDIDSLASNFPGWERRTTSGASLTGNVDVGSGTLTSVTSYRESDLDAAFDSDSTELEVLRLDPLWERQRQFSQELRFTSAADSRLKWLAGLYYFVEQPTSFSFLPFSFPFGTASLTLNAENVTRSHAAFADATYSATERLHVSAGIRYSEERKTFEFEQGGAGVPVFATIPRSRSRISDHAVTPRAGIDYRWSDELMAYLSVSRGFKSGGFAGYNPLPVGSAGPPPFEPEYIWAYELGVKTEMFDRRARLNTAAFFYDYTDLQVRIPDEFGFVVIRNAGTAKIRGVEVELLAQPIPALEISGNVAYLDAEYTEFSYTLGSVMVDNAGRKLLRAPEWKGALNAAYTVDLGNAGSLTLRGEYSHEGRSFYEDTNDPVYSHSPLDIANARITYRTPTEQFAVTAFGNNLGGERYYTHVIPVLGAPIGFANVPRVVGIEVELKF